MWLCLILKTMLFPNSYTMTYYASGYHLWTKQKRIFEESPSSFLSKVPVFLETHQKNWRREAVWTYEHITRTVRKDTHTHTPIQAEARLGVRMVKHYPDSCKMLEEFNYTDVDLLESFPEIHIFHQHSAAKLINRLLSRHKSACKDIFVEFNFTKKTLLLVNV